MTNVKLKNIESHSKIGLVNEEIYAPKTEKIGKKIRVVLGINFMPQKNRFLCPNLCPKLCPKSWQGNEKRLKKGEYLYKNAKKKRIYARFFA